MISIVQADSFVFRYPLQTPVQTSFGTMRDRPMVLVRLRDKDGFVGWGEVWCNFPNVGAEHRARLLESVFSPLLLSQSFSSEDAAFQSLTDSTAVLAIQTGEFGPIAQCIAGLDIAIHDLVAKREGKPVWRRLGGQTSVVPVYASGINPTGAEAVAERALSAGYRHLKLKIGFDETSDRANLSSLRGLLKGSGKLMADANQAWSVEEARLRAPALSEFNLFWLEEPIAANRPAVEWQELKDSVPIPLAGGENFASDDVFSAALQDKTLSVVQPDLAKWGGLTRCVPLGREINVSGLLYCPHYLGGGVGLVASAHGLAAVGGDGMLEVDINGNPLRSELIGDMLSASPGFATLSDTPGLGVEPDLSWLVRFRVDH